MGKIKNTLKSVRIKLFFTICIVITMIILLLVIVNNVVLEKFYLYNKTKTMKQIYKQINTSYNNELPYEKIEENLRVLSINNNLDILIKTDENILMLATDNYKTDYADEIEFFSNIKQKGEILRKLYQEKMIDINIVKENDTKINYIIVSAYLDNGYKLYMRTPTADLQESARI